jgi:type II secretory pathway pseudopilin PulG
MSVDNEKLISRYLLGELPEDQQVEIEDRAFSDKDYLATITTVENDLIDEYVRGELSAADQKRFESRFLASAERRKRVEFAKALRTVVSQSAAPEKNVVQTATGWSWRESLYAFLNGLNPAARLAFAAVAILVVAGAALLFVETLRLRRQVTQLQAEKQAGQNLQQSLEAERKRNEELNARLDQEKQQREQTDESLRQLTETPEARNPAPPPVIASLTLLPGLSRGGGQKPTLDLSNDARLVRLQIGIDPEEQYKSFAVELGTLSGRQVWNRENLAARTRRGSRTVGLTLPATVLKSGEYELRLRGLTEGGGSEDVGFYYFNVRKK